MVSVNVGDQDEVGLAEGFVWPLATDRIDGNRRAIPFHHERGVFHRMKRQRPLAGRDRIVGRRPRKNNRCEKHARHSENE